jgi:hypothetical protein
MSFQNPSQRTKDPILSHSFLVKGGPKLVVIKTAPKTIKGKKEPNKTFHLVTISVEGVDHTYFIPNRTIEDSLKQHVGQTVVLIASGNDKQGTASMEIQPAGIPASSLPNAAQSAPQQLHKPTEKVVTAPAQRDRAAKQFLCQAANLMRLCVKKANDIAVELNLPEQHRQGIATTLFIQADRQGHISAMPITAYTPEQLGFGASKAESLKSPEPNND